MISLNKISAKEIESPHMDHPFIFPFLNNPSLSDNFYRILNDENPIGLINFKRNPDGFKVYYIYIYPEHRGNDYASMVHDDLFSNEKMYTFVYSDIIRDGLLRRGYVQDSEDNSKFYKPD